MGGRFRRFNVVVSCPIQRALEEWKFQYLRKARCYRARQINFLPGKQSVNKADTLFSLSGKEELHAT
jgi:hypothetical protein